jgi:hypothetical protein
MAMPSLRRREHQHDLDRTLGLGAAEEPLGGHGSSLSLEDATCDQDATDHIGRSAIMAMARPFSEGRLPRPSRGVYTPR